MHKLEKYSSYKDSGVEWFGKMPEHWEITRLCNLGSFAASGIDKLTVKNESKVQIINYTDVYSNVNHTISSKKSFMVVTTPESNRIKHLVNKGDLIFLPSSETYEDLGLSALVDEDIQNLSYSYHVLRFKFKMKVYHEYKKYLTNNNFVLNNFSKEGTGSIRKTIGRFVFRNSKVILPPYEEQTKIANFLDKKTAQIDEAIKQKEELIRLLKERRQVLINNAVTKGINKTVTMKDSGVEWIGEIPEHWEIVKNRVLFSERNEAGNEELPILMVSIHTAVSSEEIDDDKNIRGKIRIKDKTSYKLVQPTDIVFNMMRAWQGAIGTVRVEGMVSPAYIVGKSSSDINTEFFEYQYRTENFIQEMDRFSKGITDFRKRLYWDEFKRLNTLLPPVKEQKEIVKYIKLNSDKIENAISLQEQEIKKIKEYKATLIDSAVTGKVRVV